MPFEREELIQFLGSIYPFFKRPPAELETALNLAEEFYFEPGQMIYEEGGEAESLFIVVDGQVQLKRRRQPEGRRQHTDQTLAVLEAGDFFGYEMLEVKGVYHATATTNEGAAVLIFNRQQLSDLVAAIPDLETSLETIFSSYRLAQRVYLSWLQPNEVIHYLGRRHPFNLVMRLAPPALAGLVGVPLLGGWALTSDLMLLPLLLLGGLALGLLFWVIWASVDWSNDYAVVTNQKVVFQERVVLLYESRQEAPISAVLAVSEDTSQVGRLVGYGDVTVRTYAGTIRLPCQDHPEQVELIINAAMQRASHVHTEAERRTMRAALRRRLGMESGPAPAGMQEPVEAVIQPGVLQRWLTHFFQIRFEQDRTITYRTHWLFLLLKLALPSLAGLILFGLAAAGIWGLIPELSGAAALVLIGGLWVGTTLWWLYQYADWRNDYYVITDDQVLDVYKKPLGREEKRAAPIKNIQSVRFERLGIIGLLLNFGTVTIKVGETDLTFDLVFNPSEVQQILLQRIAELANREKQAVLTAQREMMADYLKIYDDINRDRQPGDASGLSQEKG